MKRLMISALTLIAVVSVGTSLLRSRALLTGGQLGTASMATSDSQGSIRAVGTDLPVQDFEDRSLVFPRSMKP